MLAMEILLTLGIGIGLASVAGVRAFVPLALAALFSAFGLFSPLIRYADPGGWWTVVGVLAGLAVLEIVLDKIPALDPAFGYVMVPVRAASGAVLFAALVPALGSGLVLWLAAGAIIAGIVAVAKVLLRPPAKASSAGVSATFLSVSEDVVGLVGGALGFFVPYLPLLLVGFLLYFYYRVRRRRGRKFGGLRILGD
jgi:Domain of unknown function (DUF4126)